MAIIKDMPKGNRIVGADKIKITKKSTMDMRNQNSAVLFISNPPIKMDCISFLH